MPRNVQYWYDYYRRKIDRWWREQVPGTPIPNLDHVSGFTQAEEAGYAVARSDHDEAMEHEWHETVHDYSRDKYEAEKAKAKHERGFPWHSQSAMEERVSLGEDLAQAFEDEELEDAYAELMAQGLSKGEAFEVLRFQEMGF